LTQFTVLSKLLAVQQTSSKMGTTKQKLTLSFESEIRAAIKIEAINQGINASDLVLKWISPELKKLKIEPKNPVESTVNGAKKIKLSSARINKK
jgi:hypothetical protein